MKKILITGAGSYIGTSFEKYLQQWSNDYFIECVDMVNDNWKNMSFHGYDAIYHVAGIAHIKEREDNASLYYKVNRDLAIATAKKAKEEGVSQFIFMSSMSVYGVKAGIITKKNVENPSNSYGKSKLEAEREIVELQNEFFKVAILRPPMVYGKGCKGNYQKLRKLALTIPVFPYVHNQRSMIYIGNLCEFVKDIIDKKAYGLYFPQNVEYVCTSELVSEIAKCNGKKCILVPGFHFVLKRISFDIFKKIFGTLIYEKIDTIDRFGFSESIFLTEN